jgi:hypothetical protein
MLKQIDHKVDHVGAEVHFLDKELRQMIQENQFGSEFMTKEQEIRNMQKELDRIHKEKSAQQHQVPSGSIFSQFGPSFPSPTLLVSTSVFPTLIGDPIPLMFSNLSSSV